MRHLFVIILTLGLLSPLKSLADEPENRPFDLTVRILDKKGKAPKGNITASIQGRQVAYPFPKTGVISISGVEPNDTINIISGKHFFQVPVCGLDSINILFKNSWTIEGYYRKNFEEIIDQGYYAMKREGNSGSSTGVDMRGAENYNTLLDFMRGRVSGVEVRGSSIQIRGVTTINSGTEPLIIVDGMPMELGAANSNIRPRDIESITVDKTGSMYGVRGANGVIIITTKRSGQ